MAYITIIWNFLMQTGPLALKIFELLAGGLGFIIDYFILQKVRLQNAFNDEVAAKKKAREEQAAKESANVKAFQKIVEDSWRIRYNTILTNIKAGLYEDVLILRKKVDDPVVDNILFDNALSPEYRAMKIVEIMRSHDVITK